MKLFALETFQVYGTTNLTVHAIVLATWTAYQDSPIVSGKAKKQGIRNERVSYL